MIKDVYPLIEKYAEMMSQQAYPTGEEARLMVKVASGCYATVKGADLAALQESDIVYLEGNSPEENILKGDNEINAIVISNTPYCKICNEQGKAIKAILDDMAQIVGPKAELVNYQTKELEKALKKATGCFVRGRYTISTGRSLYEAVVAMTVLEKSAEVFQKAALIGGGKPINFFEAKIMSEIYKRKYSKAEQKVKESESENI